MSGEWSSRLWRSESPSTNRRSPFTFPQTLANAEGFAKHHPLVKILDRYVFRQVLVTSLFAVAVLSVVLVVGKLFKELLDLLVNHDAPLDLILSFIAYILPFSLTFTIRGAFSPRCSLSSARCPRRTG